MAKLLRLVRQIRPAPFGVLVGSALGLSRRRFVTTEDGSFFVNPLSDLGFELLHGYTVNKALGPWVYTFGAQCET